MATILSDGFKFIINFVYLGHNQFFQYDMFIYWHDELIFNKQVFKNFSLKSNIDNGSFQTFDDRGEPLVNTIKKALNGNPSYWRPSADPWITLAFYTKSFFPFMEPNYEVIKSDPELEKDLKMNPDDDDISTIVFIDAYHFKDKNECNLFCQQGVSLNLVLARNTLTDFVSDLENEYKQFCIDNKFQPIF